MPEPVAALPRREFLQVGAGAAVAGSALTMAPGLTSPVAAADDPKPILPRRKLGKTGVDVTMLTLGTGGRSPAMDRLLRTSYASGVRYVDTATVYGSEPAIGKWFEAMPEVRKEIFLVSKDHNKDIGQLTTLIDKRLAALKTDYLDAYFFHGIGDDPNESVDMPKSKEFKEVVEKLKKSGKVKFVGFSTHCARRAQFLQSASEGGFIDLIMVQYTPWLDKDSPMNKALDACHAAGIGLISMKQVAGKGGGPSGIPTVDALEEVQKRVPELKAKGLTPYQGLLQAIWSDERIASACVSMRSVEQIRENSEAAKSFKEPMKRAEVLKLRDAFVSVGQTLCADCDGRCGHAAGTKAALGDLTRFLTYHEFHGDRSEARRQYAALPAEARDWAGADLEAARAACPNGLNFAELLPRVDRNLA